MNSSLLPITFLIKISLNIVPKSLNFATKKFLKMWRLKCYFVLFISFIQYIISVKFTFKKPKTTTIYIVRNLNQLSKLADVFSFSCRIIIILLDIRRGHENAGAIRHDGYRFIIITIFFLIATRIRFFFSSIIYFSSSPSFSLFWSFYVRDVVIVRVCACILYTYQNCDWPPLIKPKRPL